MYFKSMLAYMYINENTFVAVLLLLSTLTLSTIVDLSYFKSEAAKVFLTGKNMIDSLVLLVCCYKLLFCLLRYLGARDNIMHKVYCVVLALYS